MHVTFDLTKEDMKTFMHQHYEHSPSLRRTAAIFRYVLTAVLVGAGVGVGIVLGDKPWLYLPVGVVGGGVYFAIFPRFWRKSIDKQTEKMLAEGKNRGLLGRQELEVDADGIVERSTHGELKARWSSVERIRETRALVLIYISSVQAIIVPKRDLKGGQADALLEALEASWREAAGDSAPIVERLEAAT